MQNVVCHIQGCPFLNSGVFCGKETIVIENNGVCSFLTQPQWKQQKEVEKAREKKAREAREVKEAGYTEQLTENTRQPASAQIQPEENKQGLGESSR